MGPCGLHPGGGLPVEGLRRTTRNTQTAPGVTAHRLRDEHDLTDVIGGVRERPMQSFVDAQRLGADVDRAGKVHVTELADCVEERPPARFPHLQQLAAAERRRLEFVVSFPPWLL